jgi:hypothetical protein
MKKVKDRFDVELTVGLIGFGCSLFVIALVIMFLHK